MIGRTIGIGGMVLVALCAAQPAAAQGLTTIESYLSTLIGQLQSGGADQDTFSPAMWKTITQQTGGAGHYAQLEKLGPVSSVYILKQTTDPDRKTYDAVATHKAGLSTWHLRIARRTDRIEWLSFHRSDNVLPKPGSIPAAPATPDSSAPKPAAPAPPPPSAPTLSTSKPAAPAQPPSPAPSPTSNSEACRKFPNLC